MDPVEKRLAGFRSLFTDDAEQDFREAGIDPRPGSILRRMSPERCVASMAISGAFKANIHKFVPVHRGYMPEIEITRPTTATGIRAMTDIIRPIDPSAGKGFDGHGYYHEVYEKVGSARKIEHQKMVRQLFLFS